MTIPDVNMYMTYIITIYNLYYRTYIMPVFIPVIPGPSKGWHFGTPWDDTSLQHPLKQPITLSRRVYSLRCPQLLCVSWPSRVRQERPWVGLFASFCHFRGQSFGYGSIPMKIPFLGGWTSILTQLFWCELQGDRVLSFDPYPFSYVRTSLNTMLDLVRIWRNLGDDA